MFDEVLDEVHLRGERPVAVRFPVRVGASRAVRLLRLALPLARVPVAQVAPSVLALGRCRRETKGRFVRRYAQLKKHSTPYLFVFFFLVRANECANVGKVSPFCAFLSSSKGQSMGDE